jgi:hypothetical protein
MTTQVLAVPQWLIVLRGIQILLSIIVLGISCYGVYWATFNVSPNHNSSYPSNV